MFDGGGAVDFRIVLVVWLDADFGGGAEIVGGIQAIKPAVKCFFGTIDGDFNFGAVIDSALGGIGGKRFLGLDGEPRAIGLALGELLEAGLHVLVGGGLRFVLGEPLHLIDDLLAAGAEQFGTIELLAGECLFPLDVHPHGLKFIEGEKVDDEEARDAEEGEKIFFAG